MNPIYLDNNATTRIAPEVLEAMFPYLANVYGNPSSQHLFGEPVKRRIGEARSAVAALLGASPTELVFTSGATESNHTAIMGALAMRPGRREIVTMSVEHPSVLRLFRRLGETGYRVTFLPVHSDGAPDMDVLQETVTEETALVSMMWANNETGVVFPVTEAVGVAKNKGALFHTDAVQAIGKIPVNLSENPADLLSVSGHKLHAPKGIGVLFVRKGLTLPPLLFGHQERGRRGGTENVPGIVGLGKACELAALGMADDMERVRGLRDRLEQGILRAVPTARVNGGRHGRVPNTANLCFGTMDAEAILSRLNRLGIAVSAGSACSSGGTEPSHVLTAMGLSREEALASIRFSLSRYTTIEEISKVLEVLPGIMEELTAMDLVRG
ncbi:MAG: aminotransferase class V-fold PLP-dependent enzyme [Nitrospirota bacterium]